MMEPHETIMMKLTDISTAWAEALAQDADIEAFCQTRFGKSFTVYLGLNEKTARPQMDKTADRQGDAPCIIIRPGAKIEGPGADTGQNVYDVGVSWMIFNDQTVTHPTIPNLKILSGLADVEDFGYLLVRKIILLKFGSPVSQWEYELDYENHFPRFKGHAALSLEKPHVIGAAMTYE